MCCTQKIKRLTIWFSSHIAHAQVWPSLFLLVAAVALLANLAFLILGTAEVQPWNSVGSFGTVQGLCVGKEKGPDHQLHSGRHQQEEQEQQASTVRKRSKQQELVLQIQEHPSLAVRKRSNQHAETIVLQL